MFGAIATGILFLVLFIFNFVLTPPKMEGEAKKAADRIGIELGKKIDALEKRILDREAA